jgi:hypothetical protein
MAVLLKCYAENMRGDAVSVLNNKHPPNTSNPQPGDRVFIWKVQNPSSSHTPGFGLAERGSLVSPPIPNIERSGESLFRVEIDACQPASPVRQ